jgi:hypothetical protein
MIGGGEPAILKLFGKRRAGPRAGAVPQARSDLPAPGDCKRILRLPGATAATAVAGGSCILVRVHAHSIAMSGETGTAGRDLADQAANRS